VKPVRDAAAERSSERRTDTALGTSAVVTMSPHMQWRQPTPPRSSLHGERRTVLARPSPRQKSASKSIVIAADACPSTRWTILGRHDDDRRGCWLR
jgi:hypothetical protein